ncbi:alpha/beta fold hydrolase [Nonomuraea sp. N2-4H]|jgi:nucleoside-diphosphate-sugar epimerase/pimeloyl-ACP methyl ester carboxylesterase|uniref:alpha/beta fold hydrolase n=1 Tax=Nonomuraea sp. N2-4H TaxID=3128898 RepID=UPI003250A310
MSSDSPDSIVFGAAGFIGRAVVAELLRRGNRVAAAVRGNPDRLTPWLDGEGVPLGGLSVVRADITTSGLGLPPTGLDGVRDVYNCAARFAFGLSVEEARAANVTGALNVLDWAAERAGLRRVVHISGYRVSPGPGGEQPDYRREGAYEASKKEGDTAIRARAAERGIPLTIANPSTAIGPGQFLGLASMVSDLWHGRLPAVPGGREVFVPVVDVRYLAAFMTRLPEHEETAGRAYWILDDRTPVLPDLIALLARHMGVRAPRHSIPVGLLRRLPRALIGVDPETLSFLSPDRYDTGPARAFAERAGLSPPPIEDALTSWADDLVAARFGAAPAPSGPYGYQDVAGVRTWVIGEREHPGYVLLHGLPLDAGSWRQVTDRLGAPALAADLPGQGRSGPPAEEPLPPEETLDVWMSGLLRPVRRRPVLVAHSFACGPALRYAAAHPHAISRLVLVAPAFLQRPGPRLSRSWAAVPLLRRLPRARLAAMLGVPEGDLADLARPGRARNVVAALRAGHSQRDELRRLLERVEVPVEIVVGSDDPLAVAVDVPVTTIDGAGHYPQLTHPATLAARLEGELSPRTGVVTRQASWKLTR